MTVTRRAFGAGCLIAATLASITAARAQSYPNQPVRVIVPFTPGGGTDILTRLLTGKVTALTGWAFVVDNKPGAGGNIGMDAIVKAKPDGYTVGMGQTANLAVNPTLYPKLAYDPLTQVAPVALVASQPVILVVREASPFRTLASKTVITCTGERKIAFDTSNTYQPGSRLHVGAYTHSSCTP